MNVDYFVFMVGAGVVSIILGIIGIYVALSRRSWPNAVGRILVNEEIETLKQPIFNSNFQPVSKHTFRAVGDSSRKKALRLSYVYVVGEYKYIGTKLYSSVLLQYIPTQILGINPGDKVQVFYSPSNPEVSFLAHSFTRLGWVYIVTGVILVAIALYMKF